MNYKQMNINHSYISRGNNNIADSFLNPALKCTKEYKRSVGFFSSGVFDTIMDGILAMARNGGKMKLIASPQLSKEDVKAINLGYAQKEKKISDAFTKDFVAEIEKLTDLRLQMLCDLIRKDILDIKIAITEDTGIYHDKLGVMRDFDDNIMVFYGSSNSSYSGYRSNYEKIRISKGWETGFEDIVADEEREFDTLWGGKNPFVTVQNYTRTAEENLIKVIRNRASAPKENGIKLRDYQEEAIGAWVNNNYHGFYVMATGTGKTWTAIFSARELVKKHESMIVICAPYKHLVKQWSEDVQTAFPNAKIILVSSENPGWDNQITNEIIRSKYNADTQIIVISTISSFKTKRFDDAIQKYKGDRLLIVDEAHRFTVRPQELHTTYKYMLGLSATPFSGTSAAKGNELMKFFGGQVFSLPIEDALERGFLVPYYYYPIYVYASEEEEERFRKYTNTILGCFKNGICINKDLLVKTLRNRLRVISMAEEKQSKIRTIISSVTENDHFVVYCGDGKLYDDSTGEELRHIQSIKRVLSEFEYKASQFTAKENMTERMQLVDSFNKGEISALAAIRCLDEGINIPSIKSALILSSNDDYREFVQRRGRILRTHLGKKNAKIYDVIVLPKSSERQWAMIELRRYHEYAKLALNWEELQDQLDDMLIEYNLQIEDIDVYDYEEMEDLGDE